MIHLFHPKLSNSLIIIFYLVVPDCGKIIVFCKYKILYANELLKYLIERNDIIRRTIPKLFIPLMSTLLLKMENAFMPGFSKITWTSLKIPEFCDEITDVLDYIEVFVKDVRCYTYTYNGCSKCGQVSFKKMYDRGLYVIDSFRLSYILNILCGNAT